MRHSIAPHLTRATLGRAHHQLTSAMQTILHQTELLLQRRMVFSPSGWPVEPDTPSLDGLEVTESTWDEWSEVMAGQGRSHQRR